MEIIEIGAVRVSARSGEIESEFQSFVKPVRNSVLTSFCRELTTITQADVDEAPSYPEVRVTFADWLNEEPKYDFCSWGDYDRKQFEKDSVVHQVPYPFSGQHRNLKKEFSTALSEKKRYGLGMAIRRIGLEFDGTAHRGIDDARNIAKVYRFLLEQR